MCVYKLSLKVDLGCFCILNETRSQKAPQPEAKPLNTSVPDGRRMCVPAIRREGLPAFLRPLYLSTRVSALKHKAFYCVGLYYRNGVDGQFNNLIQLQSSCVEWNMYKIHTV